MAFFPTAAPHTPWWDAPFSARLGHPLLTYLLRAGGRVKIGQTRRLPERLRKLSACVPGPIALMAITNIPEGVLHEQFKAKRLHHEWFKLDAELRAWIAELPRHGVMGTWRQWL